MAFKINDVVRGVFGRSGIVKNVKHMSGFGILKDYDLYLVMFHDGNVEWVNGWYLEAV